MAFCEDCGAPLSPGVMFCENCGAKISVSTKEPAFNIVETGVIFTNLQLLGQVSGLDRNGIMNHINSFISTAGERGIGYELFDVAENGGATSVKEHVNLVKQIVEKSHPKYLFILGSSKVIPSIIWTNEASDSNSDADVSSDLPYSTLDINSPFEGQTYDFENGLRVGRLPECDFDTYFANLKTGCGNVGEIKPFALSADVWKAESADIFKNISTKNVLTSPDCTKDNVKSYMPADTNLFLFNLHGSNATEYWYGQQGASYPEALDHTSLNGIQKPYFLMVEACYGAYYDGRSTNSSILLSALNGKCISFLGSSRIAFGTPSPKGCCADVVATEHLKNLKSGMSAGDSLQIARNVLMQGSDDAETVKTLAEFSLYGDPSARMNGMPPASKSLFAKTVSKSFERGIHIPLPDVRRAVKLELTTVEQKIAEAVESFVYSKYDDLKGIKPKYYKSQNSSDLSAVFQNQCKVGDKIVNVRFTQHGQIKNIIESK